MTGILNFAGGVVFAFILLAGAGTALAVIIRGWGQWRCLALGHQWASPAEDGDLYGVAYRTTGVLSWRAGSHCARCDRYALLAPVALARRFVAARTWHGRRPR